MGYEVLDSGGTAGGGPAARPDTAGGGLPARPGSSGGRPVHPAGPDDRAASGVDILELDDDAATVPDEPRAAWRPTRAGFLTATVVVASLLVGALVGALVTQRQEEAQQRQAREAMLAASATVTELSPSDTGSAAVAVLTARFMNLGPLPIEVLTTGGARPLGTTVSVVAPSTTVDPGEAPPLTVTVPLDCRRPDVQDDVTVGVRTADRRVHQVSVQMPFGDTQTLRRAMCNGGNEVAVQASLGSSVTRPVLRLVNDSDSDLRLSITNGAELPPAEDGGPIATVTTDPVLPVLLRAGDRREIRVVVRVRRCLSDLGRLRNGNYLELEAVSLRGSSRSNVVVDIGPLIGAAMFRTCPR